MPKRQSVCLDFKKALQDKLDSLPAKRKYRALERHIENKYIDGRKPREHLELANLALEHLTSRDDAKINVKTFRKCIDDIRAFLRETPNIRKQEEGQGEPMIAVIRATRVTPDNKLFKYETTLVVKGLDAAMAGKQIFMDRAIFDASKNVNSAEMFTADKERYKDLAYRLGIKVIDRRIGQDNLAWRRLTESIRDEGSLAYILGMESKSKAIEIVDVKPLSEDPTFQPLNERRIRDFVNERYVTTRFVRYEIDLESPFLVKAGNHQEGSLRESCFYKAIAATFKTSFDKYHAGLQYGERRHDRLTPQLISRVCLKREYDGGELNMTVAQAARFFQQYSLGLRIYDPQGNELFSCMPTTFHSKIRPRILDVIYKNNHVVPITDTKTFEQFVSQRGNESKAGGPSDRYHFKKYGGNTDDDKQHVVLASSREDMVREVRRVLSETSGNTRIHVVWSGAGLNQLVLDYVQAGYTPVVQARTGVSITAMTLHNLEHAGRKVCVYVSVAGVSNGDEEVEVVSVETYEKYRELEGKLMRMLITSDYLSGYNTHTRAALREYCVSIPTGAVGEYDDDEFFSMEEAPHVIDMCKHYASCLAAASHLVSISPFDEFVLAEPGEKLRRDRLYLVDILPECEHPVYRMKDRTLMFYDELADLCDVPHRVHAHLRLILHANTQLPQLIRDIFDPNGPYADVPIDMRKGLVNRAIGELGRKKNRRRDAVVFRNEDDAKMHLCQIKRGGVKHRVADGVWLVKACAETELQDGFVPINEMIKSMSRHHMARLWRELTTLGCRVVGFKTDAVYFEPHGVDVTHTELGERLLGDGIGKAKYFRDDDGGYPRAPMTRRTTDKNVCAAKTVSASQVDALPCTVETVGEHMRPGTLVLGAAGCGKTHSTLTHVIDKYGRDRVLVVTAWNSQAKRAADEFNVVGITWHRLRGAKLDDTVRVGTRGHNVTGIAAIVVDEVMLFEHKKLVKLAAYMAAHPAIDFYATGDPKQLEAIGDVIDNSHRLKMLMSPGLFGNVVSLHVNLRLNAADRARMVALLEALDAAPSANDFVLEHFQDRLITLDKFKALEIKRAITFYNATAAALNRVIHPYVYHSRHKLDRTKEIEGVRYYYGDILLCRKKTRTAAGVMHVNYTYRIKAMNNTIFTLKDDAGDYQVPTDLIPTHFALPYCATVHSSQGDRVAEPYAIADFASDHVTKNWLMSAITRCVRLDDVYFLVTPMYTAFKKEEMRRMVHSYRAQDKLKGFKDRIGDLRVTVDWIDDQYKACGGSCKHCGVHMTFEKNSRRRASVNRLDNSRGHFIGNIELCCWDCNNRLG